MTVGKVQKILNKALVRHAKGVDRALGTNHYRRVAFKELAQIVQDYKGIAFKIGDLLTDTGLAEHGQFRRYYNPRRLSLRVVTKVTPKRITTLNYIDWCFAKRDNHPISLFAFETHKIKYDDEAEPFITDRAGSLNRRPLNYVWKKTEKTLSEMRGQPVSVSVEQVQAFIAKRFDITS